MSNQYNIYNGFPPFLRNVVNFVLTQDPVKIASGFIIGISVNKLFETFVESLIKPILAMILFFLSKSFKNFSFKYVFIFTIKYEN